MARFGGLFAVAAMVAFTTGNAYFRGVTTRAEDPSRYWSIVGGYAALALLMPALRRLAKGH